MSSGQSFFPTPFPVICGKSSGEAEESVEGWEIRADRQSPASGPALRTRKKGGWVRGREGGRGEEGEARQSGFKFRHKSKQILSFPERRARETTSNKLCLGAQTGGHRMCISSLPFFVSSFLFSITLSLFPSHPSV